MNTSPFSTSTTPLTPVTSLNPLNSIMTVLYVIGAIAIIIFVCLLIKTIKDKKNLNNEFSLKTISSIKTTSIILLVLNGLTVLGNFSAILFLVMPIISTVFICNAQKLIASNYEQAKSKANVSSILNIIICSLIVIGIPLMFIGVFILNSIWNSIGY